MEFRPMPSCLKRRNLTYEFERHHFYQYFLPTELFLESTSCRKVPMDQMVRVTSVIVWWELKPPALFCTLWRMGWIRLGSKGPSSQS